MVIHINFRIIKIFTVLVTLKLRVSEVSRSKSKIVNTRVGTLIVATIYLQLIQNVSKFYCPSL